MSESQSIPSGFCQCGCGQRTEIVARTRAGRGEIKGDPKPFVNGHRNAPLVDYDVDPETGCWNWSKTLTSNGYGVIKKQGFRQLMAHRFIYQRERGPVPDHLDMDHLCRNRACVNPDHLEPVSRSENLRRGARGKTNDSTIFLMKLVDASTNMNRVEIADMFGVSNQTVRRYLGWAGKNIYHRRKERPWGVEHRLLTSNRIGPYPKI